MSDNFCIYLTECNERYLFAVSHRIKYTRTLIWARRDCDCSSVVSDEPVLLTVLDISVSTALLSAQWGSQRLYIIADTNQVELRKIESGKIAKNTHAIWNQCACLCVCNTASELSIKIWRYKRKNVWDVIVIEMYFQTEVCCLFRD